MFDNIILLFLLAVSKVLLTTYFVTRFEPIQVPLNEFLDWSYDTHQKGSFLRKFNVLILTMIGKVVSCPICLSFWLGFLMYDFWIGCMSTLLMSIFERSIGKWLDDVKLN